MDGNGCSIGTHILSYKPTLLPARKSGTTVSFAGSIRESWARKSASPRARSVTMRRISGLPSSLRWKPSPKLSTSLRLPVGLQGRERPRPPGPPSAAGGRVRHRACREWIGPFTRCICREGARRCLASLRVSLCIRSTASPPQLDHRPQPRPTSRVPIHLGESMPKAALDHGLRPGLAHGLGEPAPAVGGRAWTRPPRTRPSCA